MVRRDKLRLLRQEIPQEGAEGEKDKVLKLSGKRTAVIEASGENSLGVTEGVSSFVSAGNLSGKRTEGNLL
jgi:hypothetical protein